MANAGQHTDLFSTIEQKDPDLFTEPSYTGIGGPLQHNGKGNAILCGLGRTLMDGTDELLKPLLVSSTRSRSEVLERTTIQRGKEKPDHTLNRQANG